MEESFDEEYELDGPETIYDAIAQHASSKPHDLDAETKEKKVQKFEKFLGRLQQEKQGGYLPKLHPDVESETYTLVLDLVETLIHFASSQEVEETGMGQDEDEQNFINSTGGQRSFRPQEMVLFRPHIMEFLNEMSQYYEIIIFIAALQDYADFILDQIDPDHHLIKHRLYRNHTTFREKDGVYLKDLTKIGRDLKRSLILDNVKENFQLQKDNGVIKTWLNDQEDNVLLEIMPLLKQIVLERVPDVRVAVRKYRDGVMRHIQYNKAKEVNNFMLLSPSNNKDQNDQQRVTTPAVTNQSVSSRNIPSPVSELAL